jgi:hypothetical protein
MPVIERRYQAAQLGSESLRYGFAIQAQTLERLAAQGYGQEEARKAYSEADRMRRLAGGFGETATEDQLVNRGFGDTEAAKKTERVQRSRAAQFGGAGGPEKAATGVSGLGNTGT